MINVRTKDLFCFIVPLVDVDRAVILIHDRSVDKIRGKTTHIVRKRDAGVLYVRQGVLTRREARDFREDVYKEIMN